jgi:uncharacterized protein (DUF2147 family)
MKKSVLRVLSLIAFTLCLTAGLAIAQETASPQAETTQANDQSGFDLLPGKWVRPDGGYTLMINSVDENGQLDASYANPRPLPFSKAVASRDGETIKVFLELTAGGYNGSTYTLVYDPSRDVLEGVYYQAVAQQKYDIYFERARP